MILSKDAPFDASQSNLIPPVVFCFSNFVAGSLKQGNRVIIGGRKLNDPDTGANLESLTLISNDAFRAQNLPNPFCNLETRIEIGIEQHHAEFLTTVARYPIERSDTPLNGRCRCFKRAV